MWGVQKTKSLTKEYTYRVRILNYYIILFQSDPLCNGTTYMVCFVKVYFLQNKSCTFYAFHESRQSGKKMCRKGISKKILKVALSPKIGGCWTDLNPMFTFQFVDLFFSYMICNNNKENM